ncbi:MAG: sensor domain-containing diguanylate cyclase [Proteobacteria bacterium]|nr:diguanylate cyclase [Pseudomonadota bacterium]NOG59292.1 sensor domain-containing diguanylate cyclase [Pseudomonadota bacterium]
MINSYDFLHLVLDSITGHITVINEEADIVYVNKSWNEFGLDNSCHIVPKWDGVNYLDECDKAAAKGDDIGGQAAAGIREVMNNEQRLFYLEYPCHSPDEQRWFMMRVTPFSMQGNKYYVIIHQNITERKLAEEKVEAISRLDGLTGISNRRCFDEFFHQEWNRCSRLKSPVSFAIIDVDYFKKINDTYGHLAGDDCLIKLAQVLEKYTKRPGDMCARYGGDEFVIVFGQTSLDISSDLINNVYKEICLLNIPNEKSPISSTVTVSIGLADMTPGKVNNENKLIDKTDKMLYSAKENGRNQVFMS